MDLRQLKFFLEIADCGGFTKAAEKLFIAQSALSTAIKKLEEELGAELFNRQNKRITLTYEGEIFALRAREILRSVDSAAQEIAGLKSLIKGEVRVGLTPMLSSFFFPKILAAFKHQYPSLQISVQGDSAWNIQRKIETGEIDLGIIAGEVPDGLDSHHILREEVVACVSRSHPLAGNKKLPAKTLLSQPLLQFKAGYAIRELIDDIARREGIGTVTAAESNIFSLLKNLAKEELGVAFLLKMAAAGTPNEVAVISCDPQIYLNHFIAWKKNTRLSPANRAFVDFLASELDEYYMLKRAAETFPLP